MDWIKNCIPSDSREMIHHASYMYLKGKICFNWPKWKIIIRKNRTKIILVFFKVTPLSHRNHVNLKFHLSRIILSVNSRGISDNNGIGTCHKNKDGLSRMGLGRLLKLVIWSFVTNVMSTNVDLLILILKIFLGKCNIKMSC